MLATIHDPRAIEAAAEDMLSRSIEDRFSISTANHFNFDKDWDLDRRGKAAIENTRQWYRENEIDQLHRLMEEHKERARQSVFSQLSAFRPEWTEFKKLKGDLHITIRNSDEPVPEEHNLFHTILNDNLHVEICLCNPDLGYVCIPIINVFASCCKVEPEEIWNAALQNKIDDSRDNVLSSRADALSAKAKALSLLKSSTSVHHPAPESSSTSVSKRTSSNAQTNSSTPANSNAKRIKQLEETIASLRREAEDIHGLFGFIKKNKIKKEISELEQELYSLRQSK